MMNGDRGSARAGVLFGAVLVVAGTILLLERLDVLPTNLLGHFWPMAMLVIGSLMFLNGRQLIGGMIVFAGAILELKRLGLIHVRLWDLWPLAIIAVGVLLLWRALFPPKNGVDIIKAPLISEYAIFGGNDVKVESMNFEGGTVTAIFGGNQVDLRSARMNGSPAVLNVDAIFGGVELKVPESWRVTTEGQSIFGGMDARKTLTPRAGEPEQHLIVRGFAVFGGVEVKN